MKQRKKRILSLLTAVTMLASAALSPAAVSAAAPSQETELFTDISEEAADFATDMADAVFTDDTETPTLEETPPSVEAAGAIATGNLQYGSPLSDYEYAKLDQAPMAASVTASTQNSDQYSEGPARYAFDGNKETGWHTNYNDHNSLNEIHYIQWNLGTDNALYTVGRLVYTPKVTGVNGRWKNVVISVQKNDNTWQDVYSGEIDELPVPQQGTTPLTATFNFTPVEAKAMKVTLNDTYNTDTAHHFGSAGEIEVYKATEKIEPNVIITPNTITLNEGDTCEMPTARIEPAIPGAELIWPAISTNGSIDNEVIREENGDIKAIGAGTYDIVAKVKIGNTTYSNTNWKCTVTVNRSNEKSVIAINGTDYTVDNLQAAIEASGTLHMNYNNTLWLSEIESIEYKSGYVRKEDFDYLTANSRDDGTYDRRRVINCSVKTFIINDSVVPRGLKNDEIPRYVFAPSRSENMVMTSLYLGKQIKGYEQPAFSELRKLTKFQAPGIENFNTLKNATTLPEISLPNVKTVTSSLVGTLTNNVMATVRLPELETANSEMLSKLTGLTTLELGSTPPQFLNDYNNPKSPTFPTGVPANIKLIIPEGAIDNYKADKGYNGETDTWWGIPLPHVHAYTYTVVDEVITESCTCDHTATATLTAEEASYTGEEIKTASVDYSENWAGAKPVITYENNTDVGTATAILTVGEVSARVEFAITKSANTTALEALIEAVTGITESENYETTYIPSVREGLEAALENAANLMKADPDILQSDVNSVYAELKEWNDMLPDSLQGDINALKEQIAKAEEIDTKKYTDETVKALTEALTKAKALSEKGAEANKTEVDAAIKALQDAIDNLALIATPTPEPPVTTPSPTPKPPVTTPSPTQKPLPDNVPGGSTWKGDTIVTPNGTEVKPDGSIVLPDGTELKPDANGTKPSISKDGTVTDTNGTSIKADGAIVLPGKDKADPKDDTIVTKGDGTKAPVYNSETGKVTVNEGNLVTHPGNMVQKPAAGSTVDSLGTITEPDGTKITSDGVTHRTDGGKISYKGEILKPATPIIEVVKATGNAPIVELEDTVFGAFGYDFVVGTEKDCIVTKDYLQIQKNKLLTETNFWYLPKGTYYFYCHAWFRNENGIKVFSGWSNAYEFEVTATTPAKPQIIKATVKGRNVTVTYRKVKDATGYDIVLGSAVRKVNGEFRPVDYGSYVKKNIDKDTVQVTFKNVKPGTYYVGMHAFNRTSTNKTKVFSPWSNRKTIRIKK